MKKYRTKSGSIYFVDGLKVRRAVRSAASESERVSEEWREAVSIDCEGVGKPLEIFWGSGSDKYSPMEGSMGRFTVTTPVMEITEEHSQ